MHELRASLVYRVCLLLLAQTTSLANRHSSYWSLSMLRKVGTNCRSTVGVSEMIPEVVCYKVAILQEQDPVPSLLLLRPNVSMHNIET